MPTALSVLRRGALALAACALFATDAARAQADPRGPALFQSWLRTHGAEAKRFQAYLNKAGVGNVVPLYQLLRSASMWRQCRAQPFQVPPVAQWSRARDVLLLLRELQRTGVLGPFEVVSAYRGPQLNRCAGGARTSSHMVSFAVDLLPARRSDAQRLCQFWRQQGRRWSMGLSRYPSGRIHIDRRAWRTWGADYTRATSFCR